MEPHFPKQGVPLVVLFEDSKIFSIELFVCQTHKLGSGRFDTKRVSELIIWFVAAGRE